jgi:hypothetical protein
MNIFLFFLYMYYKNVYVNFCYLVHTNGAVDFVYATAFNQFIGVPFSYTLFFFNDTSVVHRNLLTFITKYQSGLFI